MTSTSRPHQPLYLDLEAPATGSGERAEIMGGVYWATMPVGPDLAAINIWLLRDGDHWTVVDTGLRSSAALALAGCAGIAAAQQDGAPAAPAAPAPAPAPAIFVS